MSKKAITRIEEESCEDFIDTFNPPISKKVGKETILVTLQELIERFRASVPHYLRDKQTIDIYMEDFEYFVNKLVEHNYQEKEHGFCLIINRDYYWKDIGFVFYLKNYLTDYMVFYQLGDDN